MYTFNNVEVVHIPDQTRLSDKAKDITLYTLTRNQSLGERLLTLRLHLVCESFKPKLKRVSTFYSSKLQGYSLQHNSKLKGCANNTKVKH